MSTSKGKSGLKVTPMTDLDRARKLEQQLAEADAKNEAACVQEYNNFVQALEKKYNRRLQMTIMFPKNPPTK